MAANKSSRLFLMTSSTIRTNRHVFISLLQRLFASWLKSVSVFANGEGGTLVFGITDDDQVVGLENAEQDAELISEAIKSKLDPIPTINLEFQEVEGKKLILLHIASGDETPYYYIGDKQRVAFIRIGNESVVAYQRRRTNSR